MNLTDILTHHVEHHPDRPAVSYRDARHTYAQLLRRVQATAGGLRAAGVGRGDRVGVLLHNSDRFLEVMFGCAHLGAVFMPLNWRLAPDELDYILTHAGAAALVSEAELAEAVTAPRRLAVGATPAGWESLDALQAAAAPVLEAEQIERDDLLRLMYTSGTTSRPKGVMITLDNFLWKCAAHTVDLAITREDRGLVCGPLYHVGALDMTATNMLYVGGSIHVLRRFDATDVLDAIESERPTNVWMAPAMVNLVLAEPTLGRRDTSSVRMILDGGEKMPLPLIKRVLAAFPNGWFADAYGLTETVSLDTYLDKGKTVDKLGSVGRPVSFTEVRIEGADGDPLPAGEVGEICVRGPKVFKGYWQDPDNTAKALRRGWLHTGDLGYLDEDGFLFVVDRLKDMIISGGENIASLEVERVVQEHPSVVEAAVVGSPHPRWGEVPVAYVVVDDAATEEELIAHCAERLAKFKVPAAIRLVDVLPRNPSGKILKRDLRELEHGRATEPA